MSDEQIKAAVRSFNQALIAGDVNQIISFLAPDAVMVTQVGIFKGIEQIKNYISWMIETDIIFNITEIGIGIIVQGNIAIVEENFIGITNGKKWEAPNVSIFEFKNDKIIANRSYTDMLSVSQQAASGIFSRWAVNAVASATQKGLKINLLSSDPVSE